MFYSMKRSIGALIILCSAGMLAACNSGAGGPGPGPTSGPSGNCGGPPNQMEVLFPRPNQKNVSTGLGNVYVSTKGALPPSNQFDFFLAQSNGTSTFTGNFAPINASQLPTGSAKPTYSNPSYYATAIAGPYGTQPFLSPGQDVTLLWNDGGRNCTPHTEVSSFKTKG